uniref:Uncharacterized protein n=1 Tax=Pyrodinium bahamense TaxID=73915 RepID=A0A7S0FKM0_9DINO
MAVAASLGGAAAAGRVPAAARRASAEPSDWERAVEEANEVTELSERIHKVTGMISHWRTVHQKERRFHEQQSELIQRQIDIRRRQRQALQEELDDYEAEQEQRFNNKMCMMLLNAFHLGGDQEEKVAVLRICHGLKELSLAAPRAARQSAHPHAHRGPAEPKAEEEEDAWEGKLTLELQRIVRSLVVLEQRVERHCAGSRGCASRLRGPAEDMRGQLQQLEAQLEAIRTEYHTEKARWGAERAALNKEESELGDEVLALHAEKQTVRQRAAEKSEAHFCPVVKANYGLTEDNIREFVESECGSEGDLI